MQVNSPHHDLTRIIIGKAMDVHTQLGPGLLESAYKKCLYHELINSSLQVQSELVLPIVYKDQLVIEHGYRIDLLVENSVVIETKCVECFTDVHFAQLLTYLRLGKYPIGLLINFHVKSLKQGIKRIIHTT